MGFIIPILQMKHSKVVTRHGYLEETGQDTGTLSTIPTAVSLLEMSHFCFAQGSIFPAMSVLVLVPDTSATGCP